MMNGILGDMILFFNKDPTNIKCKQIQLEPIKQSSEAKSFLVLEGLII